MNYFSKFGFVFAGRCLLERAIVVSFCEEVHDTLE